MTITDAEAIPVRDNGDPVLVTATIRNDTGRDDELIGGSSPIAKSVRLYVHVGETPGPTDPLTGVPNVAPIVSLPIGANETLRFPRGYGGMILSGLSQPLVAGQTIQVTFEFAHADPVTVQVPVASIGL
jgi:copper(I)-binding protein